MNTKCVFSLLFVFMAMLSFVSCDKDDPAPQQLLIDGSVDEDTTPVNWFGYPGNNKSQTTWTDEAAFSGSKSLKISATVMDPTNFSYWVQSISSNIPTGKSVTLKVKIKANLTGKGVSIALRGDAIPIDVKTSQFVTTQDSNPISGAFDWHDYKLTLDNVASTTKTINIYLVYLPNTTGEVYFDDLSLVADAQ